MIYYEIVRKEDNVLCFVEAYLPHEDNYAPGVFEIHIVESEGVTNYEYDEEVGEYITPPSKDYVLPEDYISDKERIIELESKVNVLEIDLAKIRIK